uniref:ORF99 n=1 Tax=Hoilungia sp. H24 TaxID=2781606 RepID=A0A7U3RTY3_9METZ|nr:ORF99 [Hoilungia sp. H24]
MKGQSAAGILRISRPETIRHGLRRGEGILWSGAPPKGGACDPLDSAPKRKRYSPRGDPQDPRRRLAKRCRRRSSDQRPLLRRMRGNPQLLGNDSDKKYR